jgi:hypothetical protein
MDLSHSLTPRIQLEEMRIIHLNGQATTVLLSALDGDEYNRVIGVDVAKQI